jgi:hypothetical protein
LLLSIFKFFEAKETKDIDVNREYSEKILAFVLTLRLEIIDECYSRLVNHWLQRNKHGIDDKVVLIEKKNRKT